MLSIGIDSGSSTTKGVLFDGENIIEKIIEPTGANPKRAMQNVHSHLNRLAEQKGFKTYTVTTGYGRDLLDKADKSVTEITCHGKGATVLESDVLTVVDIGGQDSKVILLDRDQNVKDFIMNDKCAAGTGRFVEVIMRLLHQDLCDLDEYVIDSEPTKISSMCTVFAESEIISLLAQDVNGDSIARGVVSSICDRTAIFSKRLPIEGKVFFSGGLAQFEIIRSDLEKYLGLEVVTHEMAQFTGAIGGAASIGYRKMKDL